LSQNRDKTIPENWYLETESKLVCLHCHKTFKKEYRSKTSRQRGKGHGSGTLLSMWAWHNFRRHLFGCRHLHDYERDDSYES